MLSKRSSVRRNICTLMKKLSGSDSKNSYKRLMNDDDGGETKYKSGKVGVARGCVAIYVGEKRKRYQVPVSYLSFPDFQQLIKRAHEDDALDVKFDGPIRLACTTQTFDHLLNNITS